MLYQTVLRQFCVKLRISNTYNVYAILSDLNIYKFRMHAYENLFKGKNILKTVNWKPRKTTDFRFHNYGKIFLQKI